MPEQNRSNGPSKGGQASSQVQERDEHGQFSGRSGAPSGGSSERGQRQDESQRRDEEGKFERKK